MSRWTILLVLFGVRTSMGYQFQAIPVLSPVLMHDLAMSVADIGILIGLYHSPGVLLALPGGALGARFGDKRLVVAGLVLMLVGGIVTVLGTTVSAQFSGRLIAGIGGVALNVLMTKMVADWFAGREMATAMGIYVNSWPVGIALALLTMPGIVALGGVAAGLWMVVALVLASLVALVALYRPPGEATGKPAALAKQWPEGMALVATATAGVAWGLYNAGLAVVFGFGTLMLTERGWPLASAGMTTSIVLWLVAVSVPLGGWLGDRSGRHSAVLLASLTAFAASLAFAGRSDAVLPAFVLLGIIGGLPAGLIMSLPQKVLGPEQRATGMGLFFTLFYLVQFAGPWAAGRLAKATGSSSVTFDLGAAMVVATIVCVLAFGVLARAGAGNTVVLAGRR